MRIHAENRMTLAYFALIAVDILGDLDHVLKGTDREAYIDWIYKQQILDASVPVGARGFKGSPFVCLPKGVEAVRTFHESYHLSHITMTYNALCLLLILGDDFSRVDRPAIIASIRSLQRPDGSFAPFRESHESDVRFVFCACAISHMLNDWSGVDKDRAVAYVRSSHAYDGGIGQGPWQESHGGLTFCAISALTLMGRLDDGLVNRQQTLRWLVERQQSGFQGRINKPADTCYSFWIGAAIAILAPDMKDRSVTPLNSLIDADLNRMFLISTQADAFGGFSKFAGHHPGE